MESFRQTLMGAVDLDKEPRHQLILPPTSVPTSYLSPAEATSRPMSGFRFRTEVVNLGTDTAAAAKSLQSCPTLCDPRDGSPTRLPRPWDSSGKNTGVGCHFLLQCVKVKSESKVAQSSPTLSDPMDRSLPGSSIHGILQAGVPEWGAIRSSKSGNVCQGCILSSCLFNLYAE